MPNSEESLTEEAVLSGIPGMKKLPSAPSGPEYESWAAAYPDAAFTVQLRQCDRESHFLGLDKEQAEIHHRAYVAILQGQKISDVRFRYDRESAQYLVRHMWD